MTITIISIITKTYTAEADSDWLGGTIERYHHPGRFKTEEEIAAENKLQVIPLFDEFLSKHKLSEVRAKNYRVIKRELQQYELYVRATKRGQKGFRLVFFMYRFTSFAPSRFRNHRIFIDAC